MFAIPILAAVEVSSLVAAFSNSVASADYRLAKSAEDRSCEVAVNCPCPVCGKGHERSTVYQERGIPATVPAFFLSDRELLAPDLGVRSNNLAGIDVRFGGRAYPARESARFERPRAVLLETAEPVPGAQPIAFAPGAVSNWFYLAEHDGVPGAGVHPENPEAKRTYRPADGRTTRELPVCCLGLDASNRAVTVSFDGIVDTADERLTPPSSWRRLPADAFERDAARIERTLSASLLTVLVKLEPPPRESEGRWSFRSDSESKTDFDAIGIVAPDGLVLVPSKLTGEQIGRISRLTATLPDGRRAELAFDGAFADWNLIALRFRDGTPDGVRPLAISPTDPVMRFDETLWMVEPENENGRLRLTVTRGRQSRVLLTRDSARAADFAPDSAIRGDGNSRFSEGSGEGNLVVDSEGRLASALFTRRFSSNRWRGDRETLAGPEVARLAEGRAYNPEFAPRGEEDRNRLVWLGIESVQLTEALAREKRAQSYMAEYRRPPLVTEVYSNSPAAKAGIRVDDILLAVRRGTAAERPLEAEWSGGFDAGEFFRYVEYATSATPWPNVESDLNKELTRHGVGARLTLVYARDGSRRETEITLEAAPVHYRNAPRSRNRALGLSVCDLTFEVRRFYKFAEGDPGVVVVKVKPGSPAAVAGLKPCELVTEVNGEKVRGAKDFAEKVRNREDLTLNVRRLAETRMVRIQVKPEPTAGAKAAK